MFPVPPAVRVVLPAAREPARVTLPLVALRTTLPVTLIDVPPEMPTTGAVTVRLLRISGPPDGT